MGKYFSDVVEKAIEDIYYCYDNSRARAAAESLFQAAKEGDADACYFLSRCFSGNFYSWEYHPFEENDAAAYAMLREAVSRGSAVGVLGAIRMDMLTPDMRESMPFESVQTAWDEVYRKAEAGCLFCQYMIGNTYYFLDVIEIGDRSEQEFGSREAWDSWRREQMEESIPWFEKAFSGGMGLAGRNYRNYYGEGRGSLIPPRYEKKLEILRRGAELGYPDWMYYYAFELYYKLGKSAEALPWAQKSAEAGHLYGWDIVADIYWEGKAVERNLPYALECFERTAAYGNDAYACYLLGYGCQQNVERGKALLLGSDNTMYRNYGLGVMYAEGLGVREDIEKGVEYLKAAGEYPPAKEALTHYKKSWFGVWRRK